uniref:Si:dkey-192p21.6 n=1 Tax=Kryptolebias marmoratus TaxID=37003 RepID=A0A3Q3A2F2_KRYMA
DDSGRLKSRISRFGLKASAHLLIESRQKNKRRQMQLTLSGSVREVVLMPLWLLKPLLSWSWLRIPGVLQRLGFTYFVLSLLQTFWGWTEIPEREVSASLAQDVVLHWPQWLIIVLLETLWLCITFLMPVPDCPTGYLGAGGIGDDGLYPNCTGGAAGFIDRWMFGDNMYRYPTCKELYQTVQPFDPEGVLGTINSVVMGFLGMQVSRVACFSHVTQKMCIQNNLSRESVLCECTRDGGFIPVNKNLWSLSYVMCMGCFSFLLLGGMFFIIDIKGWWSGQPFINPGMNSILVYVGHSLLGFYFPFSWEIRFQESHWELLLQNLWGTALWVLIAYLLYRKKFFLRI